MDNRAEVCRECQEEKSIDCTYENEPSSETNNSHRSKELSRDEINAKYDEIVQNVQTSMKAKSFRKSVTRIRLTSFMISISILINGVEV